MSECLGLDILSIYLEFLKIQLGLIKNHELKQVHATLGDLTFLIVKGYLLFICYVSKVKKH